MKLCGCVSGRSIKECMAIASRYDVDLIEHRLDALTSPDALEVFYQMIDAPIIATNRSKGCSCESARVALLKRAMDAGCSYVDIEHDAEMKESLFAYAREKKVSIIHSFHDHERTEPLSRLKERYDGMKEGADIVKIVTTAKDPMEAHRLLELLVHARDDVPLVAFAMGRHGSFTRPLSLIYGAPFTFVALGRPTAPGQLSVADMRAVLKVLL